MIFNRIEIPCVNELNDTLICNVKFTKIGRVNVRVKRAYDEILYGLANMSLRALRC